MGTSSLVKDRRAEWIAIVERHLQLENAHGVEAARRVSRAYEAIGKVGILVTIRSPFCGLWRGSSGSDGGFGDAAISPSLEVLCFREGLRCLRIIMRLASG